MATVLPNQPVKFCVGSPKCEVCGAPHPERMIQNCPAPNGKVGGDCKKAKLIECPHLLDPTDKSVRVFGCGCRSEIVLTAIWGCDLHGRCVPNSKGKRLADESIQRCVVCPDRPTHPASGR